MDCGGLCVIVSGTQERLLLLVDNLDMMGVSSFTVLCLPHNNCVLFSFLCSSKLS